MQLLQAPTGCDEPASEPIEKLRMRRQLPEFSEIVRRRDETAAEMIVPHSIHNDACGELVVRARDPVRQGGSAAGRVYKRCDLWFAGREQCQKTGRDFSLDFARLEQSRRCNCGGVRGDKRVEQRLGLQVVKLLELRIEFLVAGFVFV